MGSKTWTIVQRMETLHVTVILRSLWTEKCDQGNIGGLRMGVFGIVNVDFLSGLVVHCVGVPVVVEYDLEWKRDILRNCYLSQSEPHSPANLLGAQFFWIAAFYPLNIYTLPQS